MRPSRESNERGPVRRTRLSMPPRGSSRRPPPVHSQPHRCCPECACVGHPRRMTPVVLPHYHRPVGGTTRYLPSHNVLRPARRCGQDHDPSVSMSVSVRTYATADGGAPPLTQQRAGDRATCPMFTHRTKLDVGAVTWYLASFAGKPTEQGYRRTYAAGGRCDTRVQASRLALRDRQRERGSSGSAVNPSSSARAANALR
jgi:hypothetical protein